VRARLNGTYDIDYDDGEKETGVREDLIRVIDSSEGSGAHARRSVIEEERDEETGLEVGSRVEARYGGKSKFYPGVICGKQPNGSYDIDYDDGEKEKGVERRLIRMMEGSPSRSRWGEGGNRGGQLKIGDRVEARYRGKSKYYPGVVVRARLNGSYDIDYDDGEREKSVSVEFIRVMEGPAYSPESSTPNSFVWVSVLVHMMRRVKPGMSFPSTVCDKLQRVALSLDASSSTVLWKVHKEEYGGQALHINPEAADGAMKLSNKCFVKAGDAANSFQVQGENGEVLYAVTESTDELTKWMRALCDCALVLNFDLATA